MSTLFVNNLNTASGTTITIPTGKTLVATDSKTFRAPGMVIQETFTTYNTQYSQTIGANSYGSYIGITGTRVSTLTFHSAGNTGALGVRDPCGFGIRDYASPRNDRI